MSLIKFKCYIDNLNEYPSQAIFMITFVWNDSAESPKLDNKASHRIYLQKDWKTMDDIAMILPPSILGVNINYCMWVYIESHFVNYSRLFYMIWVDFSTLILIVSN